jgi:hypothetical protein
MIMRGTRIVAGQTEACSSRYWALNTNKWLCNGTNGTDLYGVPPHRSSALGFALWSSKNLTTSACPSLAARCSGVLLREPLDTVHQGSSRLGLRCRPQVSKDKHHNRCGSVENTWGKNNFLSTLTMETTVLRGYTVHMPPVVVSEADVCTTLLNQAHYFIQPARTSRSAKLRTDACTIRKKRGSNNTRRAMPRQAFARTYRSTPLC